MTRYSTPLFSPAFSIHTPLFQKGGVVFNSPHSGATYPAAFLSQSHLSLELLRLSEDYAVNELINGVVAEGFTLMEAHFPRVFVDLNREPYELDAKIFNDDLPPYINGHSSKVINGLGTIPKFAQNRQEIYKEKLDVAEGLARIEGLYRPYHRALRGLLRETHFKFGEILLLDCHSMPFLASKSVDIVLGNRFGASCDKRYIDFVEWFFIKEGLTVERNHPYAGGFITSHYGQPAAGFHAIQIEVNRGLYMDEEAIEKARGFNELQAIFTKLANILVKEQGIYNRLAAE